MLATIRELCARHSLGTGLGVILILFSAGCPVIPRYTLDVNTTGQGGVTIEPSGGTYKSGTVVALTAVAQDGWRFDHWSGDVTVTDNPAQVTMDGDKTVTAVFVQVQYTLAASVTGQGSITLDPPGRIYDPGAVVTLTATAVTGWHFDHWSGDVTVTDNPVQVTMNGDRNVTAVFAQDQFVLTTSVFGEGSIVLDPPGGTYVTGTVVTLTASPAAGWHFGHWSGDLTGTDQSGQLTMDSAKTVAAIFVRDQYTLTMSVTGQGSVTLDPPGGTYLSGETVTLTASPNAGWHLAQWEGDLTGAVNPVQITMDASKTITAAFEQDQFTLSVSVTGQGTVTLDPPGGTYLTGTTVTLNVNPSNGWHFDQWGGDLTGTASTVQVTMDGPKTVSATFVQDQYTLSVAVTGEGTVTLEPPGGTYLSGTTVMLTPVASAGSRFDIWTVALSGKTSPATITMDENKSVGAMFASRTYTNFAPSQLCAVGSSIFFVANDPYAGQELWKSNGTLAGTDLVRDIVPGTGNAQIRLLTPFNGTPYFFAETDSSGYGLWKSDGTEDGTEEVVTLNGSWPGLPPVIVNGTMYFCAWGANVMELWKSDGTADGTVAVAEFDVTSLSGLTGVGGILYFNTYDPNAPEPNQKMSLWKSDGTADGTVSVFAGYYVGEMANLNGTLLFSADYSPAANEHYGALWTTTGQPAETSMLQHFTAANTSVPGQLTSAGDNVFFSAWDDAGTVLNTQVWQSDGVSVSLSDETSYRPWDLISVNGLLLFKALYNDQDSAVHCGLYAASGTQTSRLAEINPHIFYSYSSSQADVDGTLFFTAENNAEGVGLWKSDGTPAGTVLVSDISSAGSPPGDLTNVNGTLFFTAYDDTHGFQLWKSDGTAEGTVLVSCPQETDGDKSLRMTD